MVEQLPLIAIAIPAVGALAVLLCDRFPNLREAATLLSSGSLLALVTLGILPHVQNGQAIGARYFDMMPGVAFELAVEPLGMVYALVAAALWLPTSLYAIGYMRGNREQHQTRFYFCFAIAIGASMGIALSANLLTLFVFYEVLTFSTFPLVTHQGTAEAVRAGRTYLGILVGTSVCLLLLAILWTWTATHDLRFSTDGLFATFDADGNPEYLLSRTVLALLFVLFIYGVGKAALMPVHRWLPAAMVAPTPVSALLHAVAVVKAGVFTVTKLIVAVFGLRMLNASGIGDWLAYMAGATVIIASAIALYQDNLKRRLAYSTISQLSYVILAAALFTPLGIVAATLHIAAHAVAKITLFFAAGSIYTASHKTLVSELDGVGRRMPITMGAFAIGSLSMIGVPPTVGFISKWYLLSGAWQAEHRFAVAVIFASTVLNAGYFLPIVYRAFAKTPPPVTRTNPDHGEAPWPIVVAIATTALATVVLFAYSGFLLDLAESVIGEAR